MPSSGMEGSAGQTPLSLAEQQQCPVGFADSASSSQPLGSPSDVLASMPPPPPITPGTAMAWQAQLPTADAQPPALGTPISSSNGGAEEGSAAKILRQTLSASFHSGALAELAESLVNNPPATIAPSDLMAPTTAEIPVLDAVSVLPIISSSLEYSPAPEEGSAIAAMNECLVTLPLAANMRQRYRKIVVASKPAVVEFNSVFRSYSGVPDDTLIAKIDHVLSQLLDICDLPAFDDNPADMSRRDMRRHATDSCTKMVFVYELLHMLRDADIQVLLLVRRGRALDFLEAILDTENFRYRRLEDDPQPDRSDSDRLRVVLATTDQDPALYPADVHVVINYDESARGLFAARGAMPLDMQPTILTLTASYTLEHLGMMIPTNLDPQERKNALLIAVSKAWELILKPPHLGDRGQPHVIAEGFAALIKDPDHDWQWVPHEIPDNVLDVYYGSDNAGDLEPPRGASRSASKKRQLDDADDERDITKRVKAYPPSSLETSRIQPQLSSASESLLAQLTKSSAPTFAVSVDHLDAIASRILKLEDQLLEKEEFNKSLKEQLNNAGEQRESMTKSVRKVFKRFNEALQDRAKFEKERNGAVAHEDTLKAEISAAKEIQASLKQDNAALRQRLDEWVTAAAGSEAEAEARVGRMAQQLREAEARQAALQKRLEVQDKELAYARDAYQTSSSRTAELGNENRRLAAQVDELGRKAHDNSVEIHRVQARDAQREQERLRHELAALLAERERELDRAREEVRVLRAGRRETRQQSVPHSPRLGVMSPRGNGAAGVAVRPAANNNSNSNHAPHPSSSRGTSPAPGDRVPAGYDASGLGPGVRTVLSRNGRLPHLMD